MTKIPFLLAILVSLLSFSSFAQPQEVPKDEAEVKKLLSQKWIMTYFEINGKRNPIPAQSEETFTVKSDGTYTLDRKGKKGRQDMQEGKWRYDPQTNTLFRGKDVEKAIGKITKLTQEELIITDEPKVKGLKANGEEVRTASLIYKKL